MTGVTHVHQAINPSHNQAHLLHDKIKSHRRKQVHQKREIRHDVYSGSGTVWEHRHFTDAEIRDRDICSRSKAENRQ